MVVDGIGKYDQCSEFVDDEIDGDCDGCVFCNVGLIVSWVIGCIVGYCVDQQVEYQGE